jgi:hypothetical protein
MPADYRIDVSIRRVFSAGAGHLSHEDLTGHMNRLARDPQFDPSFSQLLDFREVKTTDLNADRIMAVSETRIFSKESKRAFVAPEAYQFGLARMYEAYRAMKDDHRIRVFTDYDEAIEWLDLEEPADPANTVKSETPHRPSPQG